MTSTAQPAALSAEEMLFADRSIAAHAGRPGALLGILERNSLAESHQLFRKALCDGTR